MPNSSSTKAEQILGPLPARCISPPPANQIRILNRICSAPRLPGAQRFQQEAVAEPMAGNSHFGDQPFGIFEPP